MSYALVVVDMQNDFVSGSLGTPQARAILPGVERRVRQAQADEDCAQILFTLDTHGEDYLQTQEGRNLPVPHCQRGSQGWALAGQLASLAQGKARLLEKGAFGSTALPNALLPGLRHVELLGVCTDICVISNALLLKAHLPELPLVVNAALCAGVTPERHAQGWPPWRPAKSKFSCNKPTKRAPANGPGSFLWA